MSEPIVVYAPDGTPERHTRANARDLVNGAGYTWYKGRPATPAGIAPFAVFKAPEGTPLAQQVLNKATGGSADGKSGGGAAASAEYALSQQLALAQQLAAKEAADAVAQSALDAASQNALDAASAAVADFSAPVEDTTDEDAALEAAVEAEAEEATADIAPTPSRRGRGRAS